MTSVQEEPRLVAKEKTSEAPALAWLLFRMLALPAAGALLGFLLLVKVVLPLVGVGSVERIVELGHHLDRPFTPAPTIAFLGNSITREGVDTRLFAETAPADWQAQNLAVSGSALGELRIQLPKVLSARPGAVALGFRPEYLGRIDDLELDKAYAYAMGGFPEAWPQDWTLADLPGISQTTYDALRSTRLAQLLHFRTAPLSVLNQAVRVRLRRGLRQIAPNNWTDPYELEFNVRDDRLTRHIESISSDVQKLLADQGRTGAKLATKMAAEIRQSGAVPVLIMLPMHPAFRQAMETPIAELRTELTQIAERESGLMVDALEVLSADEFADALHPNAAGREIYSRFLGRALASLAEHGAR